MGLIQTIKNAARYIWMHPVSEEEGNSTWSWNSCGWLLQSYWVAMPLYFCFSRKWMSGIMLARWGKRHAIFLQVIWDRWPFLGNMLSLFKTLTSDNPNSLINNLVSRSLSLSQTNLFIYFLSSLQNFDSYILSLWLS